MDGVVVKHLLVGEDEGTAADVDVRVDVEVWVVLEQHEHGGQFEGGSGFDADAHGEVVELVACTGLLVALEVGDGFDFAGGDFHDNGASLFGFVFRDGVSQGAFGDVLDADVDRGDDVVAVDGFDVVFVFYGDPYAVMYVALLVSPVLPAQDGVVGTFNAYQFVFGDIADGTSGEVAVGVDAFELGL